jgi:sodium-dependent dicarboxylate transporter 2/3/5
MSKGERWTLIVFVMTAVAWIMRSEKDIGWLIIPGINTYMPWVDDSTIAIAGAVLLFLLPVDWKQGIFTMNWEWAKKIPWGILILFGGGIALSKAFISSGLAQEIIQSFTIFHGLSIVFAVIVVGIIVSLLTEVTSNTAMASVMIPIMAVTSLSMGINPLYLMIAATFAASMAFMLPVATPPNAVAYGSGYITMHNMMRTGWVLNVIGIVIVTVAMFTIITWALGMTPDIPVWALEPVLGP